MSLVLIIFAVVVYDVVEHRLAAELDRQLRIDFDLTEAQLDRDATGRIRWLVRGAHGDEGFARLSAWFEVWSEDGRLLFRHWPVPEAEIKRSLPAPSASTLRFYGVELEDELYVRVMERPARVGGQGVVVRSFRDESAMRRTLQQIAEVFLFAWPLAIALASVGGYLVARRSLMPVSAMASQAQTITSASLSARLPNPNPQDEFGQLATVFNETLQRLENSFVELRRFTADASHELRTPLTALRLVGEVALRQDGNEPAMRDAIAGMLEEAQSLNELIDSLLALARVEGGQLPLDLQPVRIDGLLEEIRDSLALLAAQKQQRIDLQGNRDLTSTADRVLLRQALLNIVHNAIRYSPEASVITVRATADRGELTIEVADAGPGIPAEHQAKVFDRFYRVEKSRSRTEGGHGLGLAIARWSVERQGGRIELESALNQGARFRIRLPR
jgi:heavy metal sensor kinase